MFLDIIDRRKNPKGKSLINRQRFLKRHSEEMKAAVRKKIREAEVKDIASGDPKRIRIPARRTEEPTFHHGEGGEIERVLSGNKKFIQGDTLPKPGGGQGQGTGGAPDGEGEDDFIFEISHDEFLEYFFDDLELPDMVKKVLSGEDEFKLHRAGFATDGTPSNLDPVRTMRHAQMRRLAFRLPKIRRKRALEEERLRLEQQLAQSSGTNGISARERLEEISQEIETLERQIKAIPFLDDMDIRYRRHEQIPVPVTQAVMFCLMDVSASMGEWEKEMAKRFFMLLYLFLTRNYEKVDVVFIRHHHQAKEVAEEEFFTSRESGGTVVSTALDLMHKIIEERYPTTRWNVYGCQASDGDNMQEDCPVVYDRMISDILPLVQYYTYVEIKARETSELWSVYQQIDAQDTNFAMARITDGKDIYPVFRGLFEKASVSS